MVRSAKERDDARRQAKDEGRSVRGDRKAGHGKDPPPRGGRNQGGRGKGR